MTDQLLTGGVSQLLSQGLLGVIVVFLLWYAGQLQKRLDAKDEAHKLEIAAERKLNADLQQSRLDDTKALVEVVGSARSAMQAILATLGKQP
ncbi:hypothetical protein [Devosia aurantiaca]|uniref:Uncharacterized protein n=1 Tax=Devosia aurantiaca TaxID=2714858 RepID=A0A6M1SYB4_9HYPH|nr:hypothetical protein [Devosia aurantiaca]NGP19283.1 hypothetical protein [Devosia aurantiaca]